MQTNEDEFVRKPPEWRKIVLFNGPPQCGKSFGSDCVMSFVRRNAVWTNPRMMDFAEPLKKAAHALYCSFHGWDYYDTKEGAPHKSLPNGDFLGLSPREAYIGLSEDYMKAKHGDEVMGFILKKRITRESSSKVFVVPNSGFVSELQPLIDLFGQRNVLIIEVHAAEKTFAGDSRGYIGDAAKILYPHISVVKLPNVFGNQDDKDFFKMLCEGTVKKFLKIEEKE